MRTGWSSLRNKLFITLFEQKKQPLWHSCCPISLVISNMKFNRKLSEQFWRIWCFPIQSDRSCTWMPERRFKDGCRVTWLVLKRLCSSSHKSPLDASLIKGAEQGHIRGFELYLARCELWIGTVLGRRLMTFHKSTRTQVQTRMHIEKQPKSL